MELYTKVKEIYKLLLLKNTIWIKLLVSMDETSYYKRVSQNIKSLSRYAHMVVKQKS